MKLTLHMHQPPPSQVKYDEQSLQQDVRDSGLHLLLTLGMAQGIPWVPLLMD